VTNGKIKYAGINSLTYLNLQYNNNNDNRSANICKMLNCTKSEALLVWVDNLCKKRFSDSE